MRTNVENVSDVEVKVEVQIPAAEVDGEYSRQLDLIAKKVRIKGFRQGKAPKNLVKKMYGQQVGAETAMKLIEATLEEALGSVSQTILAQPNVSPAIASPGTDMDYELRVEVKPDIQISNWQGLEVSAEVHELSAEAVDGEITRLQAAQAERVPVEGRSAAEGDILVMSTHGTLDGENDERLHTHDLEVKLGSGQLIPGFEDQMVGASTGEKRTVEVSFPDDYDSEELKGRPAVFEVSVDGHFIEELPELNDDFAQDIGHDSMEALRESVTAQFQENMDRERDQVIDENLVAVLLERQAVTAPPTMVRGQLEHQANRLTQMLLMQGVPYEQAIGMAQSNREAIIRESMHAVQRYLILEALATAEEISIDDEALESGIQERIEKDGEQVARFFEQDNAKEGLRLELRERATLDLLRQHATITDAPPAEATGEDDPGDEGGDEAPATEADE